MEPGGSVPHSQGHSNNRYPDPIPHIDTYLFKVHSNILISSTALLPKGVDRRSTFNILLGKPTGKTPSKR